MGTKEEKRIYGAFSARVLPAKSRGHDHYGCAVILEIHGKQSSPENERWQGETLYHVKLKYFHCYEKKENIQRK